MNRPAPVKPDNFFLLLFNAVRRRRVPISLRIVSHSLLLVGVVMLVSAWFLNLQLRQVTREQVAAVGQSLEQQTVASATALLVANDRLSLNVVLDNLVKNPLVAHVVVYGVDKRLIAEAGVRPKGAAAEGEGVFSAPIAFQEVAVGQLTLTLDLDEFHKPMNTSQQNLGLLALIVAVVTLFLALRLGSQLTTPLLQLRLWLRAPDDPAPGNQLQDEIGDLARQLQQRLVPERPAAVPPAETPDDEELFEGLDNLLDERPSAAPRPSPAPRTPSATADAADASGDGEPFDLDLDDLDLGDLASGAAPARPAAPASALPPVHTAVLAVQLGDRDDLQRLPPQRLHDLLQRYRDCLEQAARLYHGSLLRLDDDSSLVLFHSNQSGEEYLGRALCCGELLRALGHALQIEVADRGLTLRLQLSLSQGDGLYGLAPSELLGSECCQSARQLNRHSRNLLLLDQALSGDPAVRAGARLRALASPAGTSCVERLLDPQPARLEQQLGQMLQQA